MSLAENELDIKALMISIGDIGRVAAEMKMEDGMCSFKSLLLGI